MTPCAARSAVARPGIGSCAVGHADSVAPGRPLRLAYADPPYPGKARLYRDHPDYGGEVDHAALIVRLTEYDGWALPGAMFLLATGVECPLVTAGSRERSWLVAHAWPA